MIFKSKMENCKHENIGKECYYGTRTGDYICYDCEETFSPDYFESVFKKKK